jgi:hypothetical protein
LTSTNPPSPSRGPSLHVETVLNSTEALVFTRVNVGCLQWPSGFMPISRWPY